MKVIFQQWSIKERGIVFSISKDMTQLEETMREMEANGDKPPEGEPIEVTIADHNMLACRVQLGTVFLSQFEADNVTFPE